MAIGEALPLLDAHERVTGATRYASTLRLPDMLVGKVLRSPVPHATISRINTQAAEKLPGIVAVVTAADFLEQAGFELHYGHAKDQPLIAHQRLRHIGEPIALVAAETSQAAEQALQRIEFEYEELPAVFEIFPALHPESPTLHTRYPDNLLNHAKLRHGDLEAGFASADVIVEQSFSSPLAHQAALEPQVALAQWQQGSLTLWTGTQSPYTVRRELAAIFGLPETVIRVIVPPLGGGFGSKGNVRIQPLAAALARKTGGRPVKLELTRAEEFVTVTKHETIVHIRSGVKEDGTLTARQITSYWNAGAYASSSFHLVPAGLLRSVGPYRIAAVWADAYGVYTNLPPAAAFRGAASSQTVWAHESHMDTIASRLQMDPLELRRRNLLRTGDRFATGEVHGEAHYLECLQAAAQGIGWHDPLQRQPSPSRRRGRGLAVMMKHTIANSRSECRLTIARDGALKLYTSTVEMGQGAHTALVQICAQALDIPPQRIQIVGPDTEQTPFDTQTASSRATFTMGNAVKDAAAKLKQELLGAAAELLSKPPESLEYRAGRVHDPQSGLSLSPQELLNRLERDNISAQGVFTTDEGELDPETGQGVSTPHWHQGAGACEVEVDLETGQIRILRYHSAAFAGQVINPNLARLQNDGNVIFGLGPALMEEIIVDGGQITNANLADYMIPSMLDIPTQLETSLLESESGSIHGLGEMTLPPVAPAVANAIFDAVGVRVHGLPITPESVYKELQREQ